LQTETGSASGPVLFTSCEMVYWKIIGFSDVDLVWEGTKLS